MKAGLASMSLGASSCPVSHLNRSGFSWSSTACAGITYNQSQARVGRLLGAELHLAPAQSTKALILAKYSVTVFKPTALTPCSALPFWADSSNLKEQCNICRLAWSSLLLQYSHLNLHRLHNP